MTYSSKDKEVVRQIATSLKDDDIDVLFAELVLKPGDNIPVKIDEGLERSRQLVLGMSANGLGLCAIRGGDLPLPRTAERGALLPISAD